MAKKQMTKDNLAKKNLSNSKKGKGLREWIMYMNFKIRKVLLTAEMKKDDNGKAK